MVFRFFDYFGNSRIGKDFTVGNMAFCPIAYDLFRFAVVRVRVFYYAIKIAFGVNGGIAQFIRFLRRIRNGNAGIRSVFGFVPLIRKIFAFRNGYCFYRKNNVRTV